MATPTRTQKDYENFEGLSDQELTEAYRHHRRQHGHRSAEGLERQQGGRTPQGDPRKARRHWHEILSI